MGSDGLADADGEIEGLSLADGETEDDSLADGDIDADGLTDGETLGDSDADGLILAEGDSEAEGLSDALPTAVYSTIAYVAERIDCLVAFASTAPTCKLSRALRLQAAEVAGSTRNNGQRVFHEDDPLVKAAVSASVVPLLSLNLSVPSNDPARLIRAKDLTALIVPLIPATDASCKLAV